MQKLTLLVCLIIVCNITGSFAQNQIKGVVVDSKTKKAIPYVNINVKGTQYGTISNQNGAFAINVDSFESDDSLEFRYLGYKTVVLALTDLKDGMRVKMQYESIMLQSVTVTATAPSAEKLIEKAIQMKGINYPSITEKRQVFMRNNSASHIRKMDLSLEHSTMKEIDASLIKELTDSMPKYTRNYEDRLFNLFSKKNDGKTITQKIDAIKTIKLDEDDGGELERIGEVFSNAINSRSGEKRFWKVKSGVFSGTIDTTKADSEEGRSVTVSAGGATIDTVGLVSKTNQIPLDDPWNWDFFQKRNKYNYSIEGITSIDNEQVYMIKFRPGIGAKYSGNIYITADTYAVLRIEYSYADGKHGMGISLLGISYKDMVDEGLLVYKKDESGYFLKYKMKKSVQMMGINRPIELIQKEDRRFVNKKLDEIEFDLNLITVTDDCTETLVISRERISDNLFTKAQENKVTPVRIYSYSDDIWKGYSIIEPTREMKEYKVKAHKD